MLNLNFKKKKKIRILRNAMVGTIICDVDAIKCDILHVWDIILTQKSGYYIFFRKTDMTVYTHLELYI